MKVLVTGANGFLAAYIIRNLLSRGEEVYGMLRYGADTRNLDGVDFSAVYGNIIDKKDILEATAGMDVIIHAAAVTSPSAKASEYHIINVMASQYVLEAAIQNGCKRIVYVSTSNTVGFGTKSNPGNEEMQISPEYQKNGYAVSKLKAEQIFIDAANKGMIEAVIVNPSFMIGYNATGGSTMRIFNMFLKSNPLIVPRGGKNFIYVDDAAKAICNAMYSGKNGKRYLAVNENLTYAEFFSKVEHISRMKKRRIIIPDSLLLTAGATCSLLNFFGLNLDLSKANARILTKSSFYTPARAISELGLPQTGIETAIREALLGYSLRV